MKRNRWIVLALVLALALGAAADTCIGAPKAGISPGRRRWRPLSPTRGCPEHGL